MKKISLIVGLIILVAIGGRAFWAYQQMKAEEQRVQNNIPEYNSEKPSASATSTVPKNGEQSRALKEAPASSREKQTMDEIKKLRGGGDNISVVSTAKTISSEANSLIFSFKFLDPRKEVLLDVYINTDKLYRADAKKFEKGKWIMSDAINIAPYKGKNVILSFVIEGDKDSLVDIKDLIFAEVTPLGAVDKPKAEALFVVNRPKKDQIINTPLVIEGKADARLFPDGWFRIKLLDANKNIVASANANAAIYPLAPDADGNMPFYTELIFDKKSVATSGGFLVLENNGESGLGDQTIPVKFE